MASVREMVRSLAYLVTTVKPFTLASFTILCCQALTCEAMVFPEARAGFTISAHAGSELKGSVAPQPFQMLLAASLTTSLNVSELAQKPLPVSYTHLTLPTKRIV